MFDIAFNAHLKTTFHLPIIGIKKNPHSNLYTQLGVITKGTVVEVHIIMQHVYDILKPHPFPHPFTG